MRALEFITGHVIFKLRYNQIYQLKTTNVDINSIIANDMSFISHIKNELYNFKPFFQECNGKTTYISVFNHYTITFATLSRGNLRVPVCAACQPPFCLLT